MKSINSISRIKHSIQQFLLSMTGHVMKSATSAEEMLSLIKPLRPYNVGKELIRLGGPHDGGYLVPDDLKGIDACFSPGVGDISEFERDCYRRDMKLFLADASVEKPATKDIPAHFIKKFIGSTSSGEFITMDDWVDSVAHKLSPDPKADLLLQMDIEGWEYASLIATSSALMKRFRIIVVEFHCLERLWQRHFFELARLAFDKIVENHTCVHIHLNNDVYNVDHKGRILLSHKGISMPRLAEFTFLRNDRIHTKKPVTVLPHPLDADNVSGKPPVETPEVWYKPIAGE